MPHGTYKQVHDNQKFLDMHDFQQDINRLLIWCQKNRLSINVQKTKPVFYPYSGDGEILQYVTIHNTPLNYVSSYLYLGVDIDSHLTFTTFYNNTFKKIAYKLSLLRRIRYMLTEKATLDIKNTMFCSVIDYGNIFSSSCNEGDLGDIQTLQNNALRCCYIRSLTQEIIMYRIFIKLPILP